MTVRNHDGDVRKVMNPWRKGVAAGLAYYHDRAAWSAAPFGERGPCPEVPANPYPQKSGAGSGHHQWADGLVAARSQVERARRLGHA